jgi:lysozyme family protein
MANFTSYLPILQQVEGGFQKLSGDSGNYNSLGQLVGTNYGISAKVYEIWIKRPPTEADMRNMLKGTAIEIYKAWYWKPMQGDAFKNQSVANLVVDHAVNAGVASAGKLLQRVLVSKFGKSLTIDGKVGTQTMTAVNAVNQTELFNAIKTARIEFYKSIGGEFLQSWLNRLNSFFFR